ncbi:HTH cro/C1-type domain-containing protein [Tenacibaculum sp. 190524A02b]|uniref:helix-turn-helix domain-containing protein n=1 Tax=Tenacibaculum vairaonense TaxID=3137860 RepID=UPI0032B28B2D
MQKRDISYMDTSKRIQLIIKQLGLNNSSFAKRIGVSSTTIDGYTKGRRNPKGETIISQPNFDAIKKITETFNINAYFLLGLSEEMFNKNTNSLDSFSIEEIITYIFDKKAEFRNSTVYQLLMENELKEKVIEKLKEEKQKLLDSKNIKTN